MTSNFTDKFIYNFSGITILGVKHSEIKELVTEHKSEPTYAAWSMLVAWRDASGGGAGEKRQQLVSVLVQMGRQDIVDLM